MGVETGYICANPPFTMLVGEETGSASPLTRMRLGRGPGDLYVALSPRAFESSKSLVQFCFDSSES